MTDLPANIIDIIHKGRKHIQNHGLDIQVEDRPNINPINYVPKGESFSDLLGHTSDSPETPAPKQNAR